MKTDRPRIGFIGAGKVGTALAIALSRDGYEVAAGASRRPESAAALTKLVPGARPTDAQSVVDSVDLVFLTVPDDAIEAVAASLRWRDGVSVVHMSGAATREVLATAAAQGAQTGSLHPLQSFADAELAVANLPGVVFAVEAEGALRAQLLRIVADLGGTPIELEAGDKALYHASAAYAAAYVVTLMKLATDLWRNFGWERDAALRALLPLLRGTLSNLEAVGIPAALTGPIARGDTGTFARNLAAVTTRSPEQSLVFRALAAATLPVAREKGGLDEGTEAALRKLLDEHELPGRNGG